MSLPEIASRDEWHRARKQLLQREKELTRAADALNADRRRLPMVPVQTDYVFDGPDGEARLIDLFGGHRQLIVQHFMFDPEWDDGCPSCTGAVDELAAGTLAHLAARETSFALVSRAPRAKLEAYRRRRGWTLPWYSSYGTSFNYDFHVTIDESVAPMEVNFRTRAELEQTESMRWVTTAPQPLEMPGVSCFLRDDDRIFHTNSTHGRGQEDLAAAYTFLDLTALGRQEDWEQPKGRAAAAHDATPDFSA
jgi:predicted dithiol-disulfide oxidoreductase (DUF899 family)